MNGCPPGDCVLLLPGMHDGPLVLEEEVRVFGRGRAALRSASGTVVTSDHVFEAAGGQLWATLDGLIIRREAGGALAP